MASFEQHIQQARKNLTVFSESTYVLDQYVDWQITMLFYACVHMVNAHLATFGHHYRRHEEVADAINPYRRSNASAMSIEAQKNYIKLQKLSRKSRYLLDPDSRDDAQQHVCSEDDRTRAASYLTDVADYVERQHNVSFEAQPSKSDLRCTLFYMESRAARPTV